MNTIVLLSAIAASAVSVDFSRTCGEIKPLHGVNCSPVRHETVDKVYNQAQSELGEAGIPYCRLHDVAGRYGLHHYVDIPNVFPNFDADENDPKNYDFTFTDAYLKTMVKVGVKPYYRLGVTIEGTCEVKPYNIIPPKDPAKWARICEHVIAHYNEGWADGYHWDIEYWEIWNEPEPNWSMWYKGTKEQFFELYETAAKHLKKRFPNIKIGGYGSIGFYAVDEPNHYFGSAGKGVNTAKYAEDFLDRMKACGAPVDFFSWHLYLQPPFSIDRIAVHARHCRKILDERGFTTTESHFNEWNVVGDVNMDKKSAKDWDAIKEPPVASQVAAAFAVMQATDIDKAMYYSAIPTGRYCGMFYWPSGKTTPVYESFKAFNALYRRGKSVPISGGGQGIYAVAAKSEKEGEAIMLCNISRQDKEVELNLKGLAARYFSIKRIDCQNHKLSQVGWYEASQRILLPASSVTLLERVEKLPEGAKAQKCADVFSCALLPGEYWWGGHTFEGLSMPYSADKPFADSLIDENKCNQTAGLLLSSKGRWLWNDEPFKFSFANGVLHARDNCKGRFIIGVAPEKTLRGAYKDVSGRFFPADGKMPDELLFTAPQWNTWVELTYNQNQCDILAYAESIVRNGFTPGVLMVDDTWQHSYGVWDFNFKRFPDPKAMCDKLHAMGFKLMLWVCPYVGLDTWEYRQELNRRNGDSGCILGENGKPAVLEWWNGKSACVDFTSPIGKEWFAGKLSFLQKEYGVDGFKFDAGDMSAYRFKFKAYTPEGSTAHGQSKAYGEIGLQFPLNEYRTVWQLAGRPLAQRLQDKGNSWKDLKQCVSDILACGIMGYSFCCPDMIGGGQWTIFHGDAIKNVNFKVIARSAQMHALMPMMQFSLNPWRVMVKDEDRKYLEAISAAARIRSKFAGKILSLAKASAVSGEPIAAHMEYAFPGNGFERIADQWVLGGDLIVAPVLSEDDSRTVVLPSGVWRDDQGVEHTGPATLELKGVALDRLPYYERK